MTMKTYILRSIFSLSLMALALLAADTARACDIQQPAEEQAGEVSSETVLPAERTIEDVRRELGNSAVKVTGDFDGDCREDQAAWQGDTATWFIVNSSTGEMETLKFGLSTDAPAPKDFDEDGKTDIAVWREKDRCFYVLGSRDHKAQIYK